MKEFRGSQNYVASEELLRAANIAMVLEKPLLIKGEPGTGKTMLAEAVSQALGKKLIIWNIKSTTKAQDGLYVYDVVQRLYDSQFGGCNRTGYLRNRDTAGQAGETEENQRRETGTAGNRAGKCDFRNSFSVILGGNGVDGGRRLFYAQGPLEAARRRRRGAAGIGPG